MKLSKPDELDEDRSTGQSTGESVDPAEVEVPAPWDDDETVNLASALETLYEVAFEAGRDERSWMEDRIDELEEEVEYLTHFLNLRALEDGWVVYCEDCESELEHVGDGVVECTECDYRSEL